MLKLFSLICEAILLSVREQPTCIGQFEKVGPLFKCNIIVCFDQMVSANKRKQENER